MMDPPSHARRRTGCRGARQAGGHRRFIAPCLAPRKLKGHADHTGPRLAIETSAAFVLLVGAWLWGIFALGVHTTAAQGSPSDGAPLYPISPPRRHAL